MSRHSLSGRSRYIVGGAVIVLMVVLVVLFGIKQPAHNRTRSSSALEVAVNDGLVAAVYADKVDAGEITRAQAEVLTVLDEREGTYDEQSIVLQGVGEERAEELAARLGAKLRITKDGSYARLTLPEGTNIADVLSTTELAAYAEDVEPDWYVELCEDEATGSSEDDEDEGLGLVATDLARDSAVTFNDPYYTAQTYLTYLNTADVLGLDMASSPLVAVIDTGIDWESPEFAGRISERSYNATEDKVVADHGWDVISDEQGHGTAVAGVLAAAAGNATGIVGVAPSAQLLVIKAECDRTGRFAAVSDLVFGLYYAIEQGASVANMSFGTTSSSDPFASAVKLAVDSDVALVAAAGNDATTAATWPAANPNVVGVGALDVNSWELAAYSNFGEDNLELVAPGSVVTLLAQGGGGVAVTASNGTSFSAPLVAGAIARWKAANPHAENADVVARLRASATDLGDSGRDWRFGYGALDLESFLNGQTGVITFDMLTDEVEDVTRTFIQGKVLQDVPEPERENAMFDGWYHDDQLEDAFDHQAERLYGESGDDGVPRVTVYAGWTNEDDGQPFTYQAIDGTNPENGIEVTGYNGKRRYMSVPETIDGHTVVGIADRAFEGNATIVTASLPNTLTYIGASSFASCVKLTSIVIPDAVTEIRERAFQGCARLQAAALGEESALTTLGELAFAGCPSLRTFALGTQVSTFDGSVLLGNTSLVSISVTTGNASFALAEDGLSIVTTDGATLVYHPAGTTAAYATPAGVTMVGPYALAYSRAASVEVSEGVTSLGEGAFQAASVAAVTLPSTLGQMGSNCFLYAVGLSSLDMSATQVEDIPVKAFATCINLTTVELPRSLVSIGDAAFMYTALSSIVLPGSVTTLGADAFALTPLRSATLSASLTTLGEEVFFDCYALTTVSFPNPCALAEIPAYAFANTPALDAIELPTSLEAVHEHAFHSSGLASVTIPASVTTIEQGAFADCPQLAHVTVAEGNTTYSAVDDVLLDVSATTLVLYPAGRAGEAYELPATVRSITGYAFQGAVNLRSVTLPTGMTELSSHAFSRCYSLEQAVLSEGLSIINVNAFEYCTALTSVNIPASVLTVARYAFYCDYALTDLAFAEDSQLSRVGFAAFAYSGLTGMVLPASVRTMGQYAFAGCTGLSTFSLADGSLLSSLPAYVFDSCEGLASIDFGQGAALGTLSARSLEGLQALATVDLSGCTNLTDVGNYALNRCSALASVSLPASTQSVGRYAFYGCTSLATITIPAGVQFIGRYAFTSCAPVTLYFEAATLPAELQDDWNYGIEGYYLGTLGSYASGDWVVADGADGTVVAVRYTGSATAVDASSIDSRPVSAIGYGCFRDNTTLAQVTLGKALTTICDYAFAGTTALSAADVPAGVTYVGDHAFDGSGVAGVSFAEGSALARIGDSAFANTGSLLAIQIPASVTRISRAAFKSSAVSDVTLEEGSQLTYVGRQAFQESGVTAMAFPNSIAEIDDYAFYNASALASLDLGEPTVLKIQTHAFYGTALTSVRIPAGVTYIGELAFDAITQLEGIEVDEGNPYYLDEDGVLYDNTKTALVSYPAGRPGEVVIPANVTSIRYGAFEHSNVASVRFEEGSRLTTIGYRAFYGCDSLVNFEAPAGVTSIDRYAFAECSNLVTCDVSRATGLTGVYQGAFYNDGKLSGFALPDSVVEVGDRTFYGCASMTDDVSATSSLRTIGDGAFAYSGVTSLVAPANLLVIGAEAFRGSALQDIDLDNGVLVEIGADAFADCADFATTELVIPDTVDYIGYGALGGIESIESLTMPSLGLTLNELVDASSNLTGFPNLRELVITRVYGELPEGMAYFKEQLETVSLPTGISMIPYDCFSGCSMLSTINIPEGVKTIGIGAFDGCVCLTLIDLPSSLLRIENNAFDGCRLSKIPVFPAGLEYIGQWAFVFAEGEGEVNIPASVSFIGEGAFSYCKGITSFNVEANNGAYCSIDGVVYSKDMTTLLFAPIELVSDCYIIPQGVTKIVNYAFYGCTGVQRIELPTTLTEIGSNAFCDCSFDELSIPSSIALSSQVLSSCKMKKVILEEGHETLPSFAFFNCKYLQEVILPDSLKEIGSHAFGNCTSIRAIEVPDGVECIGSSAFEGCTSLESLCLPASLREGGTSLYVACNSIESVTIPESNEAYTIIGNSLYTKDMTRLLCANPSQQGYVELPPGLEEIADTAFRDSTITGIVLPDSLRSIGPYAFDGAKNLSSITIGPNIEYVGHDAFRGTAFYTGNIERFGDVYLDYILIDYKGTEDYYEIREGTTLMAHQAGIYSGIHTLALPESMTKVECQAFALCDNLNTLIMGHEVEEIGDYAFSGANLSRFCFSRSLKDIGLLGFGVEEISFEDGFDTAALENATLILHNLKTISVDESCANSDGLLDIFNVLRQKSSIDLSDVKSIYITANTDSLASDIDLSQSGIRGATIYCCQDPSATIWHEGWEGDNTVYYLGDWNLATFIVDGRTIASEAVKIGEVVEAPTSTEVQAALADNCVFSFHGWDIDSDGRPDTLPTTLNAYGNLTAEAVYTTHTWDEGVTVEPTCTKDGSLTYTCTTCGKTKTEKIAAPGHDFVAGEVIAPTETEDGYTTYTCSRCGETEQRDWVIAIGAKSSDWTVTTPATCEEQGEEAILTPNGHVLETRVIPALGHNWDEGVVTSEPTCTVAGARTFTCANDSSHFNTESIAALGHEWGEWETVVEATYEAPGLRRRTCTRCSEVDEQEIPQLEWVDAGGVSLSVSNTVLKPGDTLQLVATLVNPEASDPTVAWASSDESVATVDAFGMVTAAREGIAWISATAKDGTVDRCQVIVQHDHISGETVEEIGQEPTCEGAGWHDLVTYCEVCGEELSRERVEDPALGHEPGGSFAEDAVAATCESAGGYNLVVRCTRCGEALSSEHFDLPVLGHAWGEGEVTTEPTCTEEGVRTYTCANDSSHTRTEAIPAIGHSASEAARENEVAAACESAGGYDLVVRCSVCGKVLSTEHVEIPAIGHAWDGGTQTTAPTCEAEGTITYTCANDSNHTRTEAVAATGHAWDEGAVTIEPGCETEGVRTYVCANDASHTRTEAVAATGHAWDEGVVTLDPTCEAEGVRTYTCANNPIHTKTEAVAALGHDYETTVVDPTWDDAGYTLHRCTRCGDEYHTDEIESLKDTAARVAQPVSEAIATLPIADDLTLGDSEAVAAIRAAYDALTDSQKSLVEGLDVLVAAEVRIAELRAAAVDEAAAGSVDDQIAALPALDDLTLFDAASVAAARTAYEALTDSQKLLVVMLDELQIAEARIVELQEAADKAEADAAAAAGVDAAVEALPATDSLTLDDADVVAAVRALYEVLTDDQKALVLRLEVLEAAETRMAELLMARFTGLLEALPAIDQLTLSDAAAVEAARAAYDALPDWLKDDESRATIEAAEACIAVLREEAAQKEIDLEAARPVVALIAALPATADLVIADADAVIAARAAYDALTINQQALVGNYAALIAAEAQLAELSRISIADAEISGLVDKEYTGAALTQDLTVTLGTATLTKGTDYEISYADNVSVGTATITLTGVGAYQGSIELTFAVTPRDLAKATIVLSATTYTFDGAVHVPAVTLTDGDTQLAAGVDYTLACSADSPAAAKTYTITATGTGNYTGTATASFRIVAQSIANAKLTLSKTAYTYTGKVQKPTVTKVGGKALVAGKDYTVTYSTASPVKAGSYTVKVVGKGNYKGSSATATFKIGKAKQVVSVSSTKVEVVTGKTAKLGATTNGDGALTYSSSNKKVATVTTKGVVKGVKAGTIKITIYAAAGTNYAKSASKTITVKVGKANTLTAKYKAATVKVSFAKVKSAQQTLASNLTVAKAKGTVTYANASTNSVTKKWTVNSNNGQLIVPKGTKKGTYVVKIKVKAAGTSDYISGAKTITYKVVVS